MRRRGRLRWAQPSSLTGRVLLGSGPSTFRIPGAVTQRHSKMAARLGVDTHVHQSGHYCAMELLAPALMSGRSRVGLGMQRWHYHADVLLDVRRLRSGTSAQVIREASDVWSVKTSRTRAGSVIGAACRWRHSPVETLRICRRPAARGWVFPRSNSQLTQAHCRQSRRGTRTPNRLITRRCHASHGHYQQLHPQWRPRGQPEPQQFTVSIAASEGELSEPAFLMQLHLPSR
jgi:hypothetical protein